MTNTNKIDGLTCFTAELEMARSPITDHKKGLILESDPTPSYYAKGNFPPNIHHLGDRHYFLPVKKSINCFQDMIYRKANELADKYGSGFSIYPGQMTFLNEEHQCIRINTNNSNNLFNFIQEFKDLGIRFYSDKHIKNYHCVVYYKKYTAFANIEEGVYQDDNNANRFFFEIPRHLDFHQFNLEMEKIKNNCDFHYFDSFMSSLFFKGKIKEFVGIYSEHCDKSKFGEFKQQIEKHFS